MNTFHSDAFVFFGATGDLAFKKIYPALQAMIKRGHLDIPVIGVARSVKDVDELRARLICRSKCRPLNRSSIGTNRCISSSSSATLAFAPEPS